MDDPKVLTAARVLREAWRSYREGSGDQCPDLYREGHDAAHLAEGLDHHPGCRWCAMDRAAAHYDAHDPPASQTPNPQTREVKPVGGTYLRDLLPQIPDPQTGDKPMSDVDDLSRAVADLNRDHPLPRCVHGRALRDHAGEALEPPCGCRAPQTPDPQTGPKE